jgi:hypothetical protein
MVLTVTSDLSRARHRPGLHVRWRRSHRARSVPAAHGKFSAVGAKPRAVPLAKSLGAEWVGSQSSSAARFYSLGQLPKRADGCPVCRFTDCNIGGSPIATSVHRSQHGVAKLHGRSVHRKQPQITESNKGRHTRQLQAHPAVPARGLRQLESPASSSFTSVTVGGSLWRRSSSALHKQMPNFRPVLDRLSTMPSSPRSLPSRRRCVRTRMRIRRRRTRSRLASLHAILGAHGT